jgi:hypothetical protein
MSISSTNRKAGPYACNGATVAFPFAFKVFAADDVRVVLTDADDAESDLALGTNYTVALNADQDANPGGTVTTVATYTTGYLITLTSKLENLQPVTLTNQGGFYPKVINNALDRLTIMVQQVFEQVGRAVKTPISSGLTPDQLIADLYAVEANAGSSATAAANSAANAAASAAAAAATLDNFDDRYLGQKTANPTTDNDGNALQIGALYYNTVEGVMRVYTGTGWIDAATGVTSDDVSFVQAGTGAVSTNVRDKLREFVSVKDFGAVGDGTTDDTTAFTKAIASLPGSGRIYVPRGKYRITSTLMLHGGLTFYGDSVVNNVFGVPTGNELPTHVFIDSDTGILFSHTSGVQMESIQFFDISFGARLVPNITPRGIATGFHFSGSWPYDIKHMTFDRCQFSNFGGYAIRVRDPNAPGANPDWNVCPVTMNDCAFYYNTIGIEFEADNADLWQLNGVAFFQGAGTYGINCKRSGLLVLNQCFGGGGTMVITSGTVRDSLVFIGCQYEGATAMLQVADTMATQKTYRPITMRDCIVEAPIVLASGCHFISSGCRYVNNIEVTVAGVVIDSFGDSFLASTAINLVAGSSVKNFTTHGADTPIGVRGPIVDGKCIKTASAAPTGGAVSYYIGDIVYNSAPAAGQPVGWLCTANGAPGTWLPFGQVGYRSQAGTPVNTVTPLFIGEEFLDTSTNKWYKSYGMAGNLWVALN